MLCFIIGLGGLLHLFVWLRVLSRVHDGVIELRRQESCYHCGYDLAGLPQDPTCPECGTVNTPQPVHKPRPEFRVDSTVATLILVATVLALASAACLQQIMIALDILRLGYSWSTACRYAASQSGPDDFGLGQLMTIFFIGLAPYIATIRPRRRAIRSLQAILAGLLVLQALSLSSPP